MKGLRYGKDSEKYMRLKEKLTKVYERRNKLMHRAMNPGEEDPFDDTEFSPRTQMLQKDPDNKGPAPPNHATMDESALGSAYNTIVRGGKAADHESVKKMSLPVRANYGKTFKGDR